MRPLHTIVVASLFATIVAMPAFAQYESVPHSVDLHGEIDQLADTQSQLVEILDQLARRVTAVEEMNQLYPGKVFEDAIRSDLTRLQQDVDRITELLQNNETPNVQSQSRAFQARLDAKISSFSKRLEQGSRSSVVAHDPICPRCGKPLSQHPPSPSQTITAASSTTVVRPVTRSAVYHPANSVARPVVITRLPVATTRRVVYTRPTTNVIRTTYQVRYYYLPR